MPKRPCRLRRRSRDVDDRVQLAAIDAERSLFTTRLVPRRKKVGLVVEVRAVAGGDAAAAGQLALKARRVPPEVLTGLAVALRDNNLRVRAEAINLAVAARPRTRAHRCPAQADTTDARRSATRSIDNINSREPAAAPSGDAGARTAALPERRSGAVRSVELPPEGPDALAALEGPRRHRPSSSVSIFERSARRARTPTCGGFAVEGLARAGHREALADAAADGAGGALRRRAAGDALRERQARAMSTRACRQLVRVRSAPHPCVRSRRRTCSTCRRRRPRAGRVAEGSQARTCGA